MTTLLIDGDIFKWRYPAALEYDLYTVSDGQVLRGKTKLKAWLKENPEGSVTFEDHVIEPVENLYRNIDASIRWWKEKFKTDEILVIFGDGKNNFRYDVYPMYKHSRVDVVKPRYSDDGLNYVKENYPWLCEEGCEADDGLAMRITADTVCISPDKDLLQVTGTHYDPFNDRITEVDETSAMFNLYAQILSGDSTDDIPGIKGIGPKKASVILADVYTIKALAAAVHDAYNAYDTELDFFTVGQLIYLLRSPDDSFLNLKEVKALL